MSTQEQGGGSLDLISQLEKGNGVQTHGDCTGSWGESVSALDCQ